MFSWADGGPYGILARKLLKLTGLSQLYLLGLRIDENWVLETLTQGTTN